LSFLIFFFFIMFCYLEILYWFFFVSFIVIIFCLSIDIYKGKHDTISSAINGNNLNSRVLLISLTILITTQFCIYLAETVSYLRFSDVHVILNIFSIITMFFVILIPGGRSFRDKATLKNKNKKVCDYAHSGFAILSLMCSWVSAIIYLVTFFHNINVLFVIFCFLVVGCLPCCCGIFLCCQCRSEEFKKLLYNDSLSVIGLKEGNKETILLTVNVNQDNIDVNKYYENTNRITLFFEFIMFLGLSALNIFFTLLTNKNYNLNINIELNKEFINIWANLFSFCGNQTIQ